SSFGVLCDTGHTLVRHSLPTRRSSDLELGIGILRLVDRPGQAEAQRAKGGDPGQAHTRRTGQVAQIYVAARVVTPFLGRAAVGVDRKSTRLNSSHVKNSYAVFCLKKKT